MSIFKYLRFAASLLVGLVFLSQAHIATAATQGSAGTTSTGTSTVSASVAARVDISNISDITFGDADLAPIISTSNQATKATNVCIWSNNPDKSYYVTASGSGAASAFSMANSTNPVIPYQVYWNATSGQTTGTQLTTGAKSAALISTASSPSCGGGVSATLLVGIMGADANTMLAATTYTGSLTLLVAPN